MVAGLEESERGKVTDEGQTAGARRQIDRPSVLTFSLCRALRADKTKDVFSIKSAFLWVSECCWSQTGAAGSLKTEVKSKDSTSYNILVTHPWALWNLRLFTYLCLLVGGFLLIGALQCFSSLKRDYVSSLQANVLSFVTGLKNMSAYFQSLTLQPVTQIRLWIVSSSVWCCTCLPAVLRACPLHFWIPVLFLWTGFLWVLFIYLAAIKGSNFDPLSSSWTIKTPSEVLYRFSHTLI